MIPFQDANLDVCQGRKGMRAPHFIRLAQIDEQRFITGCRSGVVHLTWGRVTLRFADREFRRLAELLDEANRAEHLASLREGSLSVTCRRDEECELGMGPLSLLLSPSEFQDLVRATREAVEHLDGVLASGAWDEPQREDSPPGPIGPLSRTPFSEN
jgi:hypothetical protein